MALHLTAAEVVDIDAGVGLDKVKNQLTITGSPGIGDFPCYVLADGGSDEGVRVRFAVPKYYQGGTTAPTLRVSGYLDGAPGASDTLGFGFRKTARADGEAGDVSMDAEQTVSTTIGSSGVNHSDEDFVQLAITLTGADYVADDEVVGYLYIDASGTSYAGNFLLTAIHFIAADT